MSDTSRPAEADRLQLVIDLGHTGDQVFDLRVTPDHADELQALLEDEGIYAGRILEFSATSELAIVAASFGGGLSGLALVLNAFFHRNRHKSITLRHGDESVDIKGLSTAETDALIARLLHEAHTQQLERDEQWKRLWEADKQPPE